MRVGVLPAPQHMCATPHATVRLSVGREHQTNGLTQNSTGGGPPSAVVTNSPAGAPVEAGRGGGVAALSEAPSPGTGAQQTRQQYQPAVPYGGVSWRSLKLPVMAVRGAGSGHHNCRANHRKQGEGCQSAIHSGVA